MNKSEYRLYKRISLIAILITLQLLYFPINQFVKGGVSTLLPVDKYINLSPAWAIPYLLSIFWWAGSVVWAAFMMELKQFTRFFACLSLTISLSYIIYLFYPTYVDRPIIAGDDFFTQLILFIYGNDRPYNVLPSNHTYTSLIISIFWAIWFPKWKFLWAMTALVVILSTLFTKQHAVLDLIAAIILALACYKLSGYIIKEL